jgi:GT2 family glycosyltransferase
MTFSVSIIIVSYNSKEITSNCIESLIKYSTDFEYEIIVVDNCSIDGSSEYLQERYANIILIENQTNEGFGRANNKGIEKSKFENIILLNSDTLLISNSIKKLIENFSNENDSLGAATCQLLNEDGTTQKSIFHFNASFREVLSYNLLVDKLLPDLLKRQNDINAVHGACMIFRKSNLAPLGFFDPDFFLYSEEFEWCYRIKKAGKKLHIYDDINILHLEEASSTNKEWNAKQRLLSTALLFKKTKGVFGLLFYLFLQALNSLTNFIFIWKMTKSYQRDYFKYQRLFWSQYGRYLAILIGVFEKPLKAR